MLKRVMNIILLINRYFITDIHFSYFIAPILQVTNCLRNTRIPIQDDITNCTFQSISDAMWLNDSHILIFERLAGEFRYGMTNAQHPQKAKALLERVLFLL